MQLSRRFLADNLVHVPEIDHNVLNNFLEALFDVYKGFNVSYHNDMHCLDVAQMTYILMRTDSDCFADQLDLSHLEQFSVTLAALCHDFGHDGFNNGYHVAAQS